MQTSPVRIIEYFDGTKQNIIPLFQRRYSWSRKDWDGLWNDILELLESGPNHSHFMGAIVSVPARTVPIGVSKHLVIDGQQRLTTVSLLLAALRERLEEKQALRIGGYLTNQYSDELDRLKLLPTHGDRDVYHDLVETGSTRDSSHQMAVAYNWFRQRLRAVNPLTDEPIDPSLILSTIEWKLRAVMINLDESDDPYVIFESLNYRGEPLTHADLVRNFVLMKFKNAISAGGDQERIYNDLWVPMEKSLGDKLTPFLMHYCRKDGLEVRKNTIYSSFKDRVENLQSTHDIEHELRQLHAHAHFYSTFLDPSKANFGLTIQSCLQAFDALAVTRAC